MSLCTRFMLGPVWDKKNYSLNWDFTVTRIQNIKTEYLGMIQYVAKHTEYWEYDCRLCV